MTKLSSSVTVEGSPQRIMRDEAVLWEASVTSAVGEVGDEIMRAWRGQIVEAGLGRRLANSVRDAIYPAHTVSASAAAVIYTSADDILRAHDEGSLITSKEGFWLAIPTEAVKRRVRNEKMPTPLQWEQRNNQKLRFVARPGRSALLVAEGRSTKRGIARTSKRPRLKSGRYAKNIQTIPIFLLVPKVKLPKRLDLYEASQVIAGRLDQLITRNYDRLN